MRPEFVKGTSLLISEVFHHFDCFLSTASVVKYLSFFFMEVDLKLLLVSPVQTDRCKLLEFMTFDLNATVQSGGYY